jgi:hypothetical protein
MLTLTEFGLIVSALTAIVAAVVVFEKKILLAIRLSKTLLEEAGFKKNLISKCT